MSYHSSEERYNPDLGLTNAFDIKTYSSNLKLKFVRIKFNNYTTCRPGEYQTVWKESQ